MTQTNYAGNFEVLEMIGDINGVTASGGTLNIGTVPLGFVVTGGWFSSAAGILNNTLDVGVVGGDTDAFVAALSINGVAPQIGVLMTTGAGYEETAVAGGTVAVTNTGSAAIPSVATAVSLYLVGYRKYS